MANMIKCPKTIMVAKTKRRESKAVMRIFFWGGAALILMGILGLVGLWVMVIEKVIDFIYILIT